jgi:hypothetical protein
MRAQRRWCGWHTTWEDQVFPVSDILIVAHFRENARPR